MVPQVKQHATAASIAFVLTWPQLRALRKLPAQIPARGYSYKAQSSLIEKGLAVLDGDTVRITAEGAAMLAALASLNLP